MLIVDVCIHCASKTLSRMVSLVFQINAMVMASGNRAKKVSSHKPRRLSQRQHAEFQRHLRVVEQNHIRDAEKEKQGQQPAIERGEQAGFVPERFIRQHRAELFEDDVQVEKKKHGRQDEHKNGGVEKGCPGILLCQ